MLGELISQHVDQTIIEAERLVEIALGLATVVTGVLSFGLFRAESDDTFDVVDPFLSDDL